MKSIVLLALIAALCVRASDVVTGTDANFDELIKSNSFVLVEFYAPWCGHCKKLAPEWESAATQLKGKAVLVALDATVEKDAAGKFDIKGFPTIKIFRDGELSGDYESGRTADAIVKYVKGNMGPAVNAVDSAAAVETAKSENRVAVFGFFSALSGKEYEAFETVAKQLRNSHYFAASTDASLFDGTTAPSVVVYKQFDDKREEFTGDKTDAAAIRKFVSDAGIKLVDEIGPENYKLYVDRGLPMAWLFVKPGDDASEKAKAALEHAAPSAKGKISFVFLDGTKYGQMGQRMGLSGTVFPSLAIDHEGQHFAYDEKKDVTNDGVSEFVQGYLGGKLTPTVRSETAPEPHTEKGLTTVVGSTFDELVVNGDKDIFIEFYAPWCGHCKKLTPIYEKLAAALENSDVRIAKIDGTANDFNQKLFPVQGFPTLFFIPKDTHTPINFDGDRSFDGMLTFIKKHATSEVKVDSSAAKDDEL
jgi:protein disulfide-isomerase A1